jgi:hypothetical protein
MRPIPTAEDRQLPGAPPVTLAFVVLAELGASLDHGRTPQGERSRILITGGWFEGPRIRGRILPGGADWQLQRADGLWELNAVYDMQCDDGTLIHVRNRGLWQPGPEGGDDLYAMSQPVYDAPIGPHDWLNQHCFLATVREPLDGRADAVRLEVFQVGMPALR